MSTDLRRFWRLGLIICASLALLAAALGGVGVLRGPALARATFAVDRAVATAGTRLVLTSRQPLREVAAGQVTITPTVPFTVETRESALTIRFSAPLAYGTDYTVEVTGVRSQFTDQAADWRHNFATPPATVYSLVAHASDAAAPDDSIVTGEKGSELEVLSAPGIAEYTATKNHVVAISRVNDQSSDLVAVRRVDEAPVAVQVPKVPALALLRASWDGSRFGYTANGTDSASGTNHDNTLFVQDDDLGTAPVEITNGGTPLAVQEWLFVPGVAALVALSIQGQAYLIYLDSDAPGIALGSLAQLVGFLPGTTSLVAEASGKEVLIDLAGGTTSPIAPAVDAAGDNLAGRRTLLGTDDYVAEYNQVQRSDGEQGIVTRLTRVTGGRMTVLAELGPELGQVLDSGTSRNGEFVWAVVLPPDAPLEDLTSGASDHAITLIYDLASGENVARLPGSTPVWAVD